MNDRGYKLTDSTADTGFTIWGPKLEDLFVNAFEALRQLLFPDHEPTPGNVQLKIQSLQAPGTEMLLVDFLNSVLYQIYTEALVPDKLHILALYPETIRYQMKFIPWTSPPRLEIKGVTHHRLRIRQGRKGYSATIMVDI